MTGSSQAIQARLKKPSDLAEADGGRVLKTVRDFYAANGYRPVWFDEDGPLASTEQLHAVVAAVGDGLDPAEYSLGGHPGPAPPPLEDPFRKDALPPAQLADADVHATLALARVATHLRRGRVAPGSVDKHWFGRHPREDLGLFLKTAVESGDLEGTLRALAPRHPQYEALKQALGRYREIAAQGGWPALPRRCGCGWDRGTPW